ncbi:CGNR zinc finger domain-containing protein [Microbacterium gorillae]|uniref:CGNR zinc finger domain-containing protein n=1 Tax=Microbacterium gorillae TaxID=1231063 RepID=UPI00058DF9C5|nr:ABATE domain-containing protein [Microbacterium gorillae]
MIHQFPCGTRALDFAGTLRARDIAEPNEALLDPEALDDWFAQSGLRTAGADSSSADLASAIELREAVYTLLWHRLAGERLPAAAMDHVNAVAASGSIAPALRADGIDLTGDPNACLATLAREAIEIVGGSEAALLRQCSRPECTQIYLDRSRGHRREWCSMQTCGNRVKAAAYRARHRQDSF